MEPNKVENIQPQGINVVQTEPMKTSELTNSTKLFMSSWNLLKQNWKILSSIALVPAVFMAIGQVAMSIKLSSLSSFLLFFIFSLVGIIFSIAMQPAIINAIHLLSTESGRLINIKDQYRFGFKLFWSMVFIAILYGLISAGSIVLFIVPSIIVGIYCSMYLYTRIIDDKKGLQALEESYTLVYGKWFKVLGRMAFLAVVYLVFSVVLMGLTFIIQFLFGVKDGSLSAVLVSSLINLIMSGVMVPFGLIYMYNLFISMKSCRGVAVSTGNFRKWIIAFMVLGVIALLGIITLMIVVSSSLNMR